MSLLLHSLIKRNTYSLAKYRVYIFHDFSCDVIYKPCVSLRKDCVHILNFGVKRQMIMVLT